MEPILITTAILTIGLVLFSKDHKTRNEAKQTAPLYWGPEAHKDMMMHCSNLCEGKTSVEYKPTTGSCKCGE